MVVVTVAVLAAACAAPATTGVASVGVALPSQPSTASPEPSVASRARAFPTTSREVLEPGRYSSSPPFDIPFTFEVSAGWESMHLHAEFFDVGRFNSSEELAPPIRWIAWGHPAVFHGETEVPVEDLTADEAVGLLAERDDLTSTQPTRFTFVGLEGSRLDLHAPAPDTKVFGGPGGDFALEPSLDTRLGVVALDGDLLVVMVLAPTPELEAAWLEAQPILESVELDHP